MSSPYLCEIRVISWNFAPKGWAFCNGQILQISQNQAVFALLGTMYGGNGVSTFGLPNLQGRSPFHFGNGFVEGQAGGEQSHTLSATELPSHTHLVNVTSAAASAANPDNAHNAQASTANFAAPGSGVTLSPAAFRSAGGGQPHDNMSPYLVLNFIIALEGIFPSRN